MKQFRTLYTVESYLTQQSEATLYVVPKVDAGKTKAAYRDSLFTFELTIGCEYWDSVHANQLVNNIKIDSAAYVPVDGPETRRILTIEQDVPAESRGEEGSGTQTRVITFKSAIIPEEVDSIRFTVWLSDIETPGAEPSQKHGWRMSRHEGDWRNF